MHPGLHRALLKGFRRLPVGARRRVVRTFAPSFTVGAMAFIERPDGSLLLVRQVYRKRWGVPGGLLERGEDPADAVVREVREEVGVTVELLGEPAVVVDAVPQRVDIVYRARLAPGTDADEAGPRSPEIATVEWFAPSELPELQHETADAFVALARVRAAGERVRAPGTASADGAGARSVGSGPAASPTVARPGPVRGA